MDSKTELKLDQITISLWRHGYSCSNVLASSYKANFHSEPDPSLTIWGFLSCLYQSNTYKLKYKIPESNNLIYVHVSVLIRTWLTAILLYGPHNHKLNIIISPFLKEVGSNNPLWYIPDENNPLDLKLQIRSVLNSLNSMMSIHTYLSTMIDNEYAILLKTLIEQLTRTQIILHFPPKLEATDETHNYTTHYTNEIRSIIIRYNENKWETNFMNYDNEPLSVNEDIYIKNVIDHFLNPGNFNAEKLMDWDDGSLHSLSQPYGDLSLPRKFHSDTGEHKVVNKDTPLNIKIENVKITADHYVCRGDINNFFKTVINSFIHHDYKYYPVEYIGWLMMYKFKINVVCHGNIMKEFSVHQYGVENPQYIPHKQYTGTPGYNYAVGGNTWGMELTTQLEKKEESIDIIYSKEISYYEGMINYVGNMYNLSCDKNCKTKNDAKEGDTQYANRDDKQGACSLYGPDFNRSINLTELYNDVKPKPLPSAGGKKYHYIYSNKSKRNYKKSKRNYRQSV